MGAVTSEHELERALLHTLEGLKYTRREDIRDRAALEANFRRHFQELNRVTLTDAEFARVLDEIVTPDVFAASRTLRERNTFIRDDGTSLHYTLVNTKDWCKNTFEVVHQLRINADYKGHRYDVILLINGIPVVQIELKTLGINPKRAMEQIVEYKNDPGNGYTKTLLRLYQDTPLLPPALYRQQSRPHLLPRQQQHPPLRLRRGRALSADLPVRRPRQPQGGSPRRIRREVPGKMRPGRDDRPLHRARAK